MPKITTPEDKARRYPFSGSQEDLIRKTGMAASTFYYKKEKPIQRLKGNELAALMIAQNLDPDEIVQVLKIFI